MAFSIRQNYNLLKVFLGFPAPIYVQLALTKGCNMRCQMCNTVQARHQEEELHLSQLAHLAEVLKQMGVGFLILTGGEPLLRRDIVEVIQVFISRKISVRMQSNGLLFTRERLNALKDAGLEGITISLHSLVPEKMAYLTSIPDALPRILEALCLYAEVFFDTRALHGINTVVSALNLRELPAIVEFVSRIGFAVSLIPIHLFADKQFIVRGQDEALVFKSESFAEVDAVYERLLRMKREGYSIYNSKTFLQHSPQFLKTGRVEWICKSPELYFSISPSGTFLPCVDLPGQISMLDPNFLTIWRTQAFRQTIHRQVSECSGCMYACYPEFSTMLASKRFFLEQFLEYRRLNAVHPPRPTMESMRRLLAQLQREHTYD